MKCLLIAAWTLLAAAADARVRGVVMAADATPTRTALAASVRSLHVRSIPAIDGVSSSIYEIYMQPYSYAIRPLTALVDLKSEEAEGVVKGELTLTQIHPPNGPVFITGNVSGLSKGHHGFHVHESGDMRKGCASLGPHFNPYMQSHGGPIDPYRHIGDLGNIVAGDDGVARVEIWDHAISLVGGHSVMGRSIVVHGARDDYGRGGDIESVTTGNAGARIACGVIAHATPVMPSWEWNYPLPPGVGPMEPPPGGPPPGPPAGPPAGPPPDAQPAPPAGPTLEAAQELPCCTTPAAPAPEA